MTKITQKHQNVQNTPDCDHFKGFEGNFGHLMFQEFFGHFKGFENI